MCGTKNETESIALRALEHTLGQFKQSLNSTYPGTYFGTILTKSQQYIHWAILWHNSNKVSTVHTLGYTLGQFKQSLNSTYTGTYFGTFKQSLNSTFTIPNNTLRSSKSTVILPDNMLRGQTSVNYIRKF